MGGLTAVARRAAPGALARPSTQEPGSPARRVAGSPEQSYDSCGSRCVGEDLAMHPLVLVTRERVDRP